MNPRYAQVALRAGHRCEYCHAPETVFNFPFEVEHIIPVSGEGLDAETNWALACRSCKVLPIVKTKISRN
jgi:5-methylcytosine-specific restriction endonuclease McrA